MRSELDRVDPGRSGSTLDIWVTGGGTREAIDDVRFVGNRSTGRLALAVTAAALRREHRVRLLLAADISVPAEHPNLKVDRYESATELLDRMLERPGPDALVHAAAVADYAPQPISGKVPSGQDRWTLEMVRLPKLVDQFRRNNPESHLTMFKLESQITPEELMERARVAAARAGADQVFANLLQEVGEDRHAGWLVSVEEAGGHERLEGRDTVAEALIRSVERSLAGESR